MHSPSLGFLLFKGRSVFKDHQGGSEPTSSVFENEIDEALLLSTHHSIPVFFSRVESCLVPSGAKAGKGSSD